LSTVLAWDFQHVLHSILFPSKRSQEPSRTGNLAYGSFLRPNQ
jgi:hypothetical protein